eukprot:jgi/Chlat1/5105/Chrsp33S05021
MEAVQAEAAEAVKGTSFSLIGVKDKRVVFSCRDGGGFYVDCMDPSFINVGTDSPGALPKDWLEATAEVALDCQGNIGRLLAKAARLYSRMSAKQGRSMSLDNAPQLMEDAMDHEQMRQQATPSSKAPCFSNDVPLPCRTSSALATATLQKQLALLAKMDTRREGFLAMPCDSDLYTWDIQLFGFDASEPLAKDLKAAKRHSVEMRAVFSAGYPNEPPFCRVLRPRFKPHTGHVAKGGALCLELLTPSGWTPANSIDAICIQIRAALADGRARLDLRNTKEYDEQHAWRGYQDLMKGHRWESPGESPEEGRCKRRRLSGTAMCFAKR